MEYAKTETRWIKFGDIEELVLIGKDVIGSAWGAYVSFYNLNTGENYVEKFENAGKSDGVSCLAGHPVVSMFAIAERHPNPRVLIFAYPNLDKVSTCSDGAPNGYLSSAFSGTEYLVTLSSFPQFDIILWQWRTGEKMAVRSTSVSDPKQLIKCSSMAPYTIVQLGSTSGRLVVHEISVCSRIASLLPTEIKQVDERIVSVSWTLDGNLLVSDTLGSVWLMTSDGRRRNMIIRSDVTPAHVAGRKTPMVVAVQGGILVVNANSRIRFYRRSSSEHRQSDVVWESRWELRAPSHPTKATVHWQRNSVIFYGERGDFWEIPLDDYSKAPVLDLKYSHGSGYLVIAWAYPGAQMITSFDKFGQLNAFEPATGICTGKLSLKDEGQVLCVVSHPDIPIIAMTTDAGKCLLISLYRVTDPVLLTSFHLNEQPLDNVKFSYCGRLLGVASSRNGDFFLIKGEPGSQMYVQSYLETRKQAVDFLLYEDADGGARLLVLVVTSTAATVGDMIIVYTRKPGENLFAEEKYAVELLNAFKSLNYGPRHSSDVIGAPYLSRQLHRLEIQSDFKGIRLIQALPSGHQLRNPWVYTDRHHVVTAGYDGLVIVRDGVNLEKVIAMFAPHHRQEGGTRMAIASPCGSMILSLGRNGTLVVTELSYREPNARVLNKANVKLDSSEIQRMFSKPTWGFVPEDIEDEGKSWVACQEAIKDRTEKRLSIAGRNAIMNDFEKLKAQVKALLDANEKADPKEQLPVLEFDLDKKGRELKIQNAAKDREELKVWTEKQILEEERVVSFVLKTCWKPMMVQARSIRAIFGDTCVDNYPLALKNGDQEKEHKWAHYAKTLSLEISNLDPPSGSAPREKTVSVFELSNEVGDDAENEVHRVRRTEAVAMTGTTTHRWVARDPIHFNQLQTYNYIQGAMECVFIREEIDKLKIHFNKLFDKMMSTKEQEMTEIAQRISKLRHIANELLTMFRLNCKAEIMPDPVWDQTEKPETIIVVTDEEISVRPYMTPEEKKIQETERLQEEERQLELMANDFREKTLMETMDGLLEVKWEDDVKKDVPKPLCLIEKDPAHYTEEEVKEIMAYEDKVQKLNIERDRYRELLEDEFHQTTSSIEESIKVFNEKLDAFSVEKVKLESAILQETLRLLRSKWRDLEKTRRMEKILDLKDNELIPATRYSQELMDELATLEVAVADLRNRYEALCKREKTMDDKFRGEFVDLKPPIVEHLARHYKKRPKAGKTCTCTSITFLTEIGRCVITGDSPEVLPPESIEFLKGLHRLDIMPSNLPPQIDGNHWSYLCKLRRTKIETEIRVKCCAVELAEAEQTVALYQRMIVTNQNRIVQLKEALREHRVSRQRFVEDMEVQLVLKMGQVEVPVLLGKVSDFAEAVLVPAEEVNAVNVAIIKEGRLKLSAMKRTMSFRRIIVCKEWRHAYMCKSLEDLKAEVKVLEDVKVTKEIQEYTRKFATNALKDKDVKITFERDIESLNQWYRRMVEAERNNLEKIRTTIKYRRRENVRLDAMIERISLANARDSAHVKKEAMDKENKFTKDRMEAIMKRTRLVKDVQDSYNELLVLQSELELLRLKTYPTLRFKSEAKERGDKSWM
ncbi:cilia- and flagella-associated protein 43 isoform X3 [Neodiprion lecontei]|uniref:Cilia- and flagella-associated protein 43 n=1 Tax=Neodiprion lecontei TaxID=441921 RepID=A0ABM3GJ65_NEOLC|nr:cilia- and flagella-associated protein 43 isoform X3 [Neodiprion lecontei]